MFLVMYFYIEISKWQRSQYSFSNGKGDNGEVMAFRSDLSLKADGVFNTSAPDELVKSASVMQDGIGAEFTKPPSQTAACHCPCQRQRKEMHIQKYARGACGGHIAWCGLVDFFPE